MSSTLTATFLVTLTLLLSTTGGQAQSAESTLRSGDSIIVKISGVPPEEITVVSTSYDIGDNGTINLPYIGEVKASGLRPSTLQKNIEASYRAAQIFTHPTIQVSANKEAPTQVIFVSGEVKTPSRITMSPGMTVGGSITAAGGFTDFANVKRVKLIRNGKAQELDCRQADSAAALTRVQPGDTIVVPQ
jgi:protein involved in polysaccharide export with SLBB domain